MMELNGKIKNRIKKLLALSNSSNEAEASSALTKAKMLLSRYGLSIEDLPVERRDVIEIILDSDGKYHPWQEKLLKYIAAATFTEILKIFEDERVGIRIIGRESNIITAEILYDYLMKGVERRAELFRESIDDIESFRIGMVESINQKFKIKYSQEIMLSMEKTRRKENREFIKNNYGNPEISDSWYGVDPNSYGLGKAIGKKISIDEQIPSEEK